MMEIPGLPPHVKITDASLLALLNDPAYQVTATPKGRAYYSDLLSYDLTFTPRNLRGVESHPNRRSTAYYDPQKATLGPRYEDDPDPIYGVTARLHTTDAQSVPDHPAGLMFRGISEPEWISICRTGRVASNGSYNIGTEQAGLTYWTNDIRTAMFYANSFAPPASKPTFGRHAYIVVAPIIPQSEQRKVEGTGANEIGVTRAIRMDELTHVWEGRVWSLMPPEYDIVPDHNGIYRHGGSAQSASLTWHEISVPKSIQESVQGIKFKVTASRDVEVDERPISIEMREQGMKEVTISAMVGDREIGSLKLGPSRRWVPRWPAYSAMMVYVDAEFRRQGVASQLYDFAYRKGFRPIDPDAKQSDAATALWAKNTQAQWKGLGHPMPKYRGWVPRKK